VAETPAVSVVICTRRRPQLLPRSVAAVLAQELDAPFEVIVVNDDDEPLRCRLPDDDRLVVLSGRRLGLCAGRNAGVDAARAPIVAFTDDDTVAPPDWLAHVLAAFAEHPDAVGVEGPLAFGRDVDPLYEHVPSTTLPGGYCSCNVAYRKDVVVAAGMFDERFLRPGGEDIDMGLRVAQLGPMAVSPRMVMLHPPRAISMREQILQARKVENDWLLHTKHPELSGRARPRRWGPVKWRARNQWHRLRDRELIAGSPARAARVVTIAIGSIAVAVVSVCTRPMPRVD
jgi:GT2 family glycosyltransferase